MRKIFCLCAIALLLAVPACGKVSPEKYAELREDGFGAAQGMIVSAAADALANIGMQFSAGKDELAELVKAGGALSNQIGATKRNLENAMSETGPETEAKIARFRADLDALRRKQNDLDNRIAAEFPAYAELTRPKPASSAAIRAILKPDEAMLVIVPGQSATYLFALTREDFEWARSTMNEEEIAKDVLALRKELDTNVPGTRPFDRDTAYKLYKELIFPLENTFRGKKVLFTLSSGALQSLPLHVLVTDAPKGENDDPAAIRDTHWLIDRYALVTLPAVSSLVTLRCTALRDPRDRYPGCPKTGRIELLPAQQATLAFTGIGNPLLKGETAAGKIATLGEPYGAVARGEIADVEKLRKLPKLEWSGPELQALDRQFRSGGTHLLLGADATETKVKSDPGVGQARILVFSTHALIGDDSGAQGEPGLVLTPPPAGKASRLDDGYLSASEAAKLHLSTEFVVLAACNTARVNGKLGADGLSGLARAFFYAGARAMLVSNWSVSDKATPDLMIRFFDNLNRGSSVERAIAFQNAITDMKSQSEWIEPRFWAPFILVGDAAPIR